MKIIFRYVLLANLLVIISCGKGKFLDQVSSTSLYVPKTLEDLEKLLENEILTSQAHGLIFLSADEVEVTDTYWKNTNKVERNAITWNETIYEGDDVSDDWVWTYSQVNCANQVLAGLKDIPKNTSNKEFHLYLEGAARFIRAYAFHNIAAAYALPYNSTTSNNDMGIPIRLDPNINEVSTRSTLQETYDQIIVDLKWAAQILPSRPDNLHPNRPSKSAAYGLLARVYLSMREYIKAGNYADSSLQLYSTLIDYNTIDPAITFPFAVTNPETIYQSRIFSSSNLPLGFARGWCYINDTLYGLYAANDLRRTIFFSLSPNGKPVPKGSYYGNKLPFTGLAIDEMYIIRAECYARQGLITEAMADLNLLLQKRWRSDFVPLKATGISEALKIILVERKKELVLRGLRWSDIRRLNIEHPSISLTRIINGQRYDLPPNDKRFVLPIPDRVIRLTGMTQNPR